MNAEEAVSIWVWRRADSPAVHAKQKAVGIAQVPKVEWCYPDHSLTKMTFERTDDIHWSAITWEPGGAGIEAVFTCPCGETKTVQENLEYESPVNMVKEVLALGATFKPKATT